MESRRSRLERESLRRMVEMERPLREKQMEIEALAQAQSYRRAELEAQARELEEAMEREYRHQSEEHERLEAAMTRIHVDRMRADSVRLREEGRYGQAREIERDLAHLQEDLQRAEMDEREREQDHRRVLSAELEALSSDAERLEAAGRAGAAQELREQIRQLKLELERDLER